MASNFYLPLASPSISLQLFFSAFFPLPPIPLSLSLLQVYWGSAVKRILVHFEVKNPHLRTLLSSHVLDACCIGAKPYSSHSANRVKGLLARGYRMGRPTDCPPEM